MKKKTVRRLRVIPQEAIEAMEAGQKGRDRLYFGGGYDLHACCYRGDRNGKMKEKPRIDVHAAGDGSCSLLRAAVIGGGVAAGVVLTVAACRAVRRAVRTHRLKKQIRRECEAEYANA